MKYQEPWTFLETLGEQGLGDARLADACDNAGNSEIGIRNEKKPYMSQSFELMDLLSYWRCIHIEMHKMNIAGDCMSKPIEIRGLDKLTKDLEQIKRNAKALETVKLTTSADCMRS